MILRMATLAGGFAGALGLSQFPEFSQQYVQRLGGAVDALGAVTTDFDRSAAAEGLTRDAALAEMTGSTFMERRQADMQRTFERHAALRADLQDMTQAGPFMRAYHATRFDADVARAAWAVYQPAVPLNFAGVVFAAFGFVIGGAGLGLVLGAMKRCFAWIGLRKPA